MTPEAPDFPSPRNRRLTLIFLGTALLLLPLHSGDCSTSVTAMEVGSVSAILGGVFALICCSGGFFTSP